MIGARVRHAIVRRFGWWGACALCSLAIVPEHSKHSSSIGWYLAALVCVALITASATITSGRTVGAPQSASAATHAGHAGHGGQLASAADTGDANVAFEAYKRPSPYLPAIPAGKVKHFRVVVYEHVTKVSDSVAPKRVWSFAVNGKFYRGTGLSAPMVVNQGDHVAMTFVNGGTKALNVTRGHSLDLHAASVPPGKDFETIAPGKSLHFSFIASDPGTFLYHCATGPMIEHLGAGMVGMLLVKPRHMAPVDKELWIMQQEFYPSAPGKDPDMATMMDKAPDVVAFNGYADQYKLHPIHVKRGEKIRVYLLDAGPSLPMLFHVLGTVFDKTDIEGQIGHSSQTVNLGPSQGGYVEFTLKHGGAYPFVTHSFADMMRGAMGAFVTQGVPDSAAAAF
jgi:nitrite reductase (NO-forming)